jgi:hypothetical protein
MLWYYKMQVQWNTKAFTIVKLQFLQCNKKKEKHVNVTKVKRTYIHINWANKQAHTFTFPKKIIQTCKCTTKHTNKTSKQTNKP